MSVICCFSSYRSEKTPEKSNSGRRGLGLALGLRVLFTAQQVTLYLNADERVKTFSFPAGGIQVLRLQTQQPFPIPPLSVTQQTESRPCNVVPCAQCTERFGVGIELLSVRWHLAQCLVFRKNSRKCPMNRQKYSTKVTLPGNVSTHSGADYPSLAFWLCSFTCGVISSEFPSSPPWSPQ